ncbi:MAG: hypothetical protein H7308_13065 [Chthonomonadaceae bacterium]|nr:hypothetical protein [Chthonomonadaceae bacterium]
MPLSSVGDLMRKPAGNTSGRLFFIRNEIYWGSDGVVGIWYEEGRVYKVFTKRVDLNSNSTF